MKKFMLDTKTALGTAPKTEDEDYDAKAAIVKSIEKAISDHKSAMSKTKSAARSFASAMEAMAKSFEVLGNSEASTEAMKDIATDYAAVVKKVNDQFLVDFEKAMDDSDGMTAVKGLTSECKKLESKRDSIMAEYDTYRDAVHTKELGYKKKGKDLSDSKYYQDEVAKRDSLKADFEKADKDFKDKYAELEKEKITTYRGGMAAYLTSTSHFLESIEKELAPVASKASE